MSEVGAGTSAAVQAAMTSPFLSGETRERNNRTSFETDLSARRIISSAHVVFKKTPEMHNAGF